MPRKVNIREKVHRLRAFFAAEKRMPGYNEMLDLFGAELHTTGVAVFIVPLEGRFPVAQKDMDLADDQRVPNALADVVQDRGKVRLRVELSSPIQQHGAVAVSLAVKRPVHPNPHPRTDGRIGKCDGKDPNVAGGGVIQ